MDARSDLRVPRKETFIWRKMAGGIIEVEGQCCHLLNPLGSRIWELINERNTLSDITRILLDADGLSPEQREELTEGIETFLVELERFGLISYDTEILAED